MNFLKSLSRLLARRKTEPLREPWIVRSPFSRSTARVRVTPDDSLKVGAVWRCVNYICQGISVLPWQVFKRVDEETSKIMLQNPVFRVLNVSPNPEMTPFTWREAMLQSVLLWGNGYSEIVRDGAGRVKELWFITPERVEPKRDYVTGQIYYEVNNQRGGNVNIAKEDMLHIKGPGYDGLIGYSVIAYAAQTLGAGIAMDQHNGSFYGNNATPGMVLSYPKRLSIQAKERLSAAWNAAFRGSSKSFKTAVLEEGMTAMPITIPHKDAQFIESRNFTVLDICRWFGVPPHKVFDYSETIYSTAEVANRDVVTDTLLPWATRFEQEVDKRLLGENYGGLYSRMDVTELLRGDPKARSDYYQGMMKIGAISINEVRRPENLNPIPNGDVHLVAANNYLPLDMVVSGESPVGQKQTGLHESMDEGPVEESEASEEESEEAAVSARLQEQLYLSMLGDAAEEHEGHPNMLKLLELRDELAAL